MRPKQQAKKKQAPTAKGYARLERQLALLAWLHHKLGYQTTGELLKDNKPINEGFREDGRSHICAHLESRSAQMQGLRWTPKFGQVAKRESRS